MDNFYTHICTRSNEQVTLKFKIKKNKIQEVWVQTKGDTHWSKINYLDLIEAEEFALYSLNTKDIDDVELLGDEDYPF